MKRYDVDCGLTQIFKDVFERDDLTLNDDMTARDVPGWDSFMQIEIIFAVEKTYGFTFQARELDNLVNVGDLARLIIAKTSN